MHKYIREFSQILSLTASLLLFPNLVLAQANKLDHFINKKIASMTLDEKVGQLFIVGFPYKTLHKDLEFFITTNKPGSYLLFKRNFSSIDDLKKLNQDLYRISYKVTKLPPLIAIDQEGGPVSRLPIHPPQANALALGQTQSPLLAEEMGYQTGLFLRTVGFNMNLAPVLDVANPRSQSFIGVRSFGSDPELVAEMGHSYSRGLLKAHVIPTAKHFPGTGNLRSDPHYQVVSNKSSLDYLKANDLKPFEKYSSLGPRTAMMLSHSIYPALDPAKEPASFSTKIVKDLLRNEMKYRGLVITDDLQMQGSKQLLRTEAAALKALQAGSDIVMLTWSFKEQTKAFKLVKAAVQKGELSEQDLNQKLRRILYAKAFANTFTDRDSLSELQRGPNLTSNSYSEIDATILNKNLKMGLLPKALPAKASRTPASVLRNLCVIAPTETFIESFKSGYKGPSKSLLLANGGQAKDVEAFIRKGRCDSTVIAITGPKTSRLLKELSLATKKNLVVSNLGAPHLVSHESAYLRVINLYFAHDDAGTQVAQHLEEIFRQNGMSLAHSGQTEI